MEKGSKILAELESNYPNEWKLIRRQFFLLKLRTFLLSIAIALILVSLGIYFLLPDLPFELALVPGAIAMAAFYYAFFVIKKPGVIQNLIVETILPSYFHFSKRNIDYQFSDKPYINEFRKSGLFPYQLTKIQGSYYFSGISKSFPFIAWFVNASYRGKVGESAMTMVSTSSEFSGFFGFQVIVKNLNPITRGYVLTPKNNEDTDIIALLTYYLRNPKWKQVSVADKSLSGKYAAFTPKKNPAENIRPEILLKMKSLEARALHPIAIAFKKEEVFLNIYWDKTFINIDTKRNLKSNLESILIEVENLLELADIIAKPL